MSFSSRSGGQSPLDRGDRGRSASPFAVVSSTHFESGPPASKLRLSEDDADIVETVKEEEWEERRKKTTTKTKNVERRVQRQLVLEDGEIVDDTGPVITEDKMEDIVTKEVVSDENQRPEGQLAIDPPSMEGWVATPGSIIISEKCTKTTKSHDEVQDELETEEVQHCGNVTNKEAEDHIKGESDLRQLISHRQSTGWELAKPQKRVVHEATRRKGNIDTVDVHESSKIEDGHVVTETERTVRQEQYENESAPDSDSSISDGSVHEATKETAHNLVHTKDEDLLEYYAVPKGGTLAQGVKIGEGMHVVSEDVHQDQEGNAEDAAAVDKLKKPRKPSRRDALTKRPLDYDQEEETRKTETNKWLEHHFGSESGRSEDSNELEDSADPQHSSGGNRITITMSPHPATNEDTTDASRMRRWQRDSVQSSSTPKAPPPPPPPKPERIWSTQAEPPTPAVSNSFSRSSDKIQESELAAARSRLRSTGVTLTTEENKENNAPEYAVPSKVRNKAPEYAVSSKVRSSNRYQEEPQKPERVTSLKDDVVYSSKFRSGKSKNKAPLFPSESTPTRLTLNPPPNITNVGRSQSFHVQTLPWSSSKKDTSTSFREMKKDYRSEERLDDIDTRRTYNRGPSDYRPENSWWQRQKKSTWSPPREATPPPPPRHSRRSPTNKIYFSNSPVVEAGTQTGPSPIPPPRTKRKKRPKSSYFFGQDDSSIYGSTTSHNSPNARHSSYEIYSDSSYQNDTNRSNDQGYSSLKRSPKIERRYTTTKTITPVLVIPYQDQPDRYRNRDYTNQSLSKSLWTNTVDPRRRPRVTHEEERSTTLPRKFSNRNDNNNITLPKKTYVYGQDRPSNEPQNNRYTDSYRGSMYNISHNNQDTQNDTNSFASFNNRLNNRTGKPVGRSQSFNVQAGKNYYPNSMVNGRPLSELSDQKSSTVYGSSPYVNLRSPNLIATIARTSSTRRTEDGENEVEQPIGRTSSTRRTEGGVEQPSEVKRERFMKGLLNDAPELFHYMHGEDEVDSGRGQRRNSPPSHNRPSDITSPYAPSSAKSPTYTAKVFTFGKNDNTTLLRSSSQEENRNLYNNINNNSVSENTTYPSETSPYTAENNKRNSLITNTNRKTAFNMKTSGSSLLYSPSFRSEAEERRRSRGSSLGKDRLSGDFSKVHISSGVQSGSPVLIQVRDWNTR